MLDGGAGRRGAAAAAAVGTAFSAARCLPCAAGLARAGSASRVSLRTSTAPPAVIAVAQTTAATLHAVAVAAPPATNAPPPPVAVAAAPPPAPPRPASFASSASGPAGLSAANERRTPLSAPRYSRQPSHSRMWRRARPEAFTPRS